MQELGKNTVVIVEQALEVLEANYRKEIKLKYQVKTALHNLILLIDREVPVLLDNLGPLRGLMGELERSLKQAKKSYSIFEMNLLEMKLNLLEMKLLAKGLFAA